MRTRALSLGLALALAPAWARAAPPRAAVRLEYRRDVGGEGCPAEPTALRAELMRRMGYDPFEQTGALKRLTVVMLSVPSDETVPAKADGLAAKLTLFDAAGVVAWSKTFPKGGGWSSDCSALMLHVAAYLFGVLQPPHQGGPGAPPGTPPPQPAPSSAPPPASSAPPALAAPPAARALPEPPNVPNPAPATARNVAIVSYVAAGALLGLGIGWTVDARSKRNTAQAFSAQLHQSNGHYACTNMGGGNSMDCGQLVSALQRADTAEATRNAWYVGAGVSAAVGITSTVLAFTLPSTIKGQPIPQLSVRPIGLLLQGSF